MSEDLPSVYSVLEIIYWVACLSLCSKVGVIILVLIIINFNKKKSSCTLKKCGKSTEQASLFVLTEIKVRTVPCENVSSGICGQRMPRSACAFAQSDQGFRCPQTESLETKECFNGEQMPGWDCTFVHWDMNPHVIRMFEGTFSLDAARIITVLTKQITHKARKTPLFHIQVPKT